MNTERRDKKDSLLRCQLQSRWPTTRNLHEVDKMHRQSGDDEKEKKFRREEGFLLDQGSGQLHGLGTKRMRSIVRMGTMEERGIFQRRANSSVRRFISNSPRSEVENKDSNSAAGILRLRRTGEIRQCSCALRRV